MTVHSAKGTEFPIVFIIDTVEKKLPCLNIKDKFILPVQLLKGIQSSLSDKKVTHTG